MTGPDVHATALKGMLQGAIDDSLAWAHVDALTRDGREGEALRLITPVALRLDAPLSLSVELARRRALRGEDQAVVEILKARATTVDALVLLGDAYARLGSAREARSSFERAVALDVRSVAARSRLDGASESTDRAKAMATMMGATSSQTARYRVISQLGRGGAGTVFLARDESLRRDVALKVYHARSERFRERLLHEARAAASFAHPGIVKILDVDPVRGSLTMPFYSRGSLASVVASNAVSSDALLSLCRALAAALNHVHAHGYVHRDVKASNVIVDTGCTQATLTDFGLMRKRGDALSAADASDGTPGILAPEIAPGAHVSAAFDVFSLGVLFASIGERAPALASLSTRMRSTDPAQRPSMQQVVEQLR